MATLASELPHVSLRVPGITPGDRLSMTLFFALVAHLIVILGVVFTPMERPQTRYNTLDIVLVQQKSPAPREEVDFLAQANQDGGGNSERAVRPMTPMPAPFAGEQPHLTSASQPTLAAQPMPRTKPSTERQASPRPRELSKPVIALTDADSALQVPEPEQPVPEPRTKPVADLAPEPAPAPQPVQTVKAVSLINQSLSMASLSAEINQRLESYAERPRRKWISARTREYKYASYMEAWRMKVERIGNLNYPDEARRKKLSGSLLLEVSINANGSINDIVLRRSSGHRVLDDAAIRIVRLAAPYAPLPKGILEETDILHIERTWRFLASNRFYGG